MIDDPCDGCGNMATHALCDKCVDDDVEREAKLLAECRAECERQTKYGIAQHEAAQEAIRERDALREAHERLQRNNDSYVEACRLQVEERGALTAERDALHLALRQVLDALGNGSGATEEASVEFLCRAPEEVRAVVADLRGELDALRGSSASAIPELERRQAYANAYAEAWLAAVNAGADKNEAHDIAQRKMLAWKRQDT